MKPEDRVKLLTKEENLSALAFELENAVSAKPWVSFHIWRRSARTSVKEFSSYAELVRNMGYKVVHESEKYIAIKGKNKKR